MVKLKILVIDYTSHHLEVVDALRRTFADHEVRLAVTSSFLTKFTPNLAFDPATTLVMPKKMAMRTWLAQLAPVYAEQDIVIFSTAVRAPLLLATLKLRTRAKKIAFVHNTHYFTENFPIDSKSYSAVFGRPLNSVRSCCHFLAGRWKLAKRMMKDLRNGTRFAAVAKHIDYFCFGSESLAAYFSSLTGRNNVLVLPTYGEPHPESLSRPACKGVLRVAIIGLVSPDRRNYLEIIRAFGQAHFTAPVELHILGRCAERRYGEQILAEIQRVSSRLFKVVFDPDSPFIPAGEMRWKLSEMHLLLSPIQLNFSFHFYREQYGLTKYSGAETDCIRYNRPVLLPRTYRCSALVQDFVIPYTDGADLEEIINRLQSTEQLQLLNARADQVKLALATRAAVEAFLHGAMSSGPRAVSISN